ncbi:MAG: glycerophosphodiester phosphodiesterase [Dehalococcoidia bacterium]|nr:glycerophosphodiester phosphodiesterase [Dehalococcoidia bacterium]
MCRASTNWASRSILLKMIISHRGLRTGARENTLAAFESAIKLGATAFECDLRLTADRQVVIHHDDRVMLSGKRHSISRTPLATLLDARGPGPERLLTLDEVLDFAGHKKVPVFLETKSASEAMVYAVGDALERRRSWDQAYVTGFSIYIRTAVRMQDQFPDMRVVQFLELPLMARTIRMPRSSYGVSLGWIEGMVGSGILFNATVTHGSLASLRQRLEDHGFKVFGGILNNRWALEKFTSAGITDIMTDNVRGVAAFFARQAALERRNTRLPLSKR